MLHQQSKHDTFQEFDKDPQQAQVSHPPKENNEHLGKAYVVEALVSAIHTSYIIHTS